MKIRFFISILSVLLGLLFYYMQDPFLLAGGSDAGEIIISPDHNSQWWALFCFFIAMIFPTKLVPVDRQIAVTLKTLLVVVSIAPLLASGHTYRMSSRSHALIDSWFFFPVQTLELTDDGFLEDASQTDDGIYVSVKSKGRIRQRIIAGPLMFGLPKTDIVELLESFGIPKEN